MARLNPLHVTPYNVVTAEQINVTAQDSATRRTLIGPKSLFPSLPRPPTSRQTSYSGLAPV